MLPYMFAIDNILKQDEEHARIIEEHMVNNAANPFETDNSIEVLSNITTSVHVLIEILNSQNLTQLTWDRRNKKKVKSKMTVASKSGNNFSILNAEFVFWRALVLSECREDVSLEMIMSHPIGAVPWRWLHSQECHIWTCSYARV